MRHSPPPTSLSGRISSLYELRQDAPHYDEIERADRPQLRISISGGGHYHFANGTVDPAYRVCIVGPTSGPVRGIGYGPMHVAGAGLLPTAWTAIAGVDAHRWIDRTIDAEPLFGAPATELAEAVAATDCTDRRFALIGAFVERVAATTDPHVATFVGIVDAWLCSSPDPPLDALVSASGVSMRQLERLTKRCYGLPPKTLARKYRALRAATALARGEDPHDTVIGASFYDQSHLIREVKRFAGLTPSQIIKRESSMLTEVVTQRKSRAGQVGPLASDA